MKKKNKVGGKALTLVKSFFPGVTTVTDGHKDAVIKVTPKDNRESIALDHAHCALAIASRRCLRADGVIIGTKTAYVIHGKAAVRFRLLESASREIVSFDRKAGFAPGTYKLKAPGKWEQLGVEFTGRTHYKSGRKNLPMRHYTANIRSILGHTTEELELATR